MDFSLVRSCNFAFASTSTGCGICLGTTFGASFEPQGGLKKHHIVLKERLFIIVPYLNKAENADFQSCTAWRGYIIIAMLILSNAYAKQCLC